MDQSKHDVKTEHEATRIAITPVSMIAASKTKMLSTNDLEKMLSDIFKHTTPDYYGCRIRGDMSGRITADLFFVDSNRDLAPGQFKAVAAIGSYVDKKMGRLASTINYWNRRNATSNKYELTYDAKEALAPFVPRDPRFLSSNKFDPKTHRPMINWKAVVHEEYEQSTFNQNSTIIIRVPLDLTYIISRIYGTKSEEGRFQYDIKVMRPLNPMRDPNGREFASKWLFAVMQINEKEIAEAFDVAGCIPMTNSLDINRI